MEDMAGIVNYLKLFAGGPGGIRTPEGECHVVYSHARLSASVPTLSSGIISRIIPSFKLPKAKSPSHNHNKKQ